MVSFILFLANHFYTLGCAHNTVIQFFASHISFLDFLTVQVKAVEQELDAEDEEAALAGQME